MQPSYISDLLVMLYNFKNLPDAFIARIVDFVWSMQQRIEWLEDELEVSEKRVRNHAYEIAEVREDLRVTSERLAQSRKAESTFTKVAGLWWFKNNPSDVIKYVVERTHSVAYSDGKPNKIALIKGLRALLQDEGLPCGLTGTKDAVEEWLATDEGATWFATLKQQFHDKTIEALKQKLLGDDPYLGHDH